MVKAFETLKDPAKREIYNLSLKNAHFREADASVYEDYFYNTDSNRNLRDYYANKWYGFRKPMEKTLYDEYMEKKKVKRDEDVIWKTLIIRLSLICGILFCCDFLKYGRRSFKEKKFQLQKEVIVQGSLDTEISKYINQRQFKQSL